MNLAQLIRPNSVSIFASDPATIGKVAAFIFETTPIPVPGRVRLDLTQSINIGRRVRATRSPVERAVADNLVREPVTLSVRGSLSANPLGLLSAQIGLAGSIVRRDLREVKKLQKIQAAGEPVVVVTPSEIFPSMSMSIDEVHDGSHKVELSLTFEEIRIVSPFTVAVVLDLDTLLAGAGGTSDLGGQPVEVLDEPTAIGGGLG
jgi:hypothetical protein